MPDALFNLQEEPSPESRTLGTVGARAEWMSYRTTPPSPASCHGLIAHTTESRNVVGMKTERESLSSQRLRRVNPTRSLRRGTIFGTIGHYI